MSEILTTHSVGFCVIRIKLSCLSLENAIACRSHIIVRKVSIITTIYVLSDCMTEIKLPAVTKSTLSQTTFSICTG